MSPLGNSELGSFQAVSPLSFSYFPFAGLEPNSWTQLYTQLLVET